MKAARAIPAIAAALAALSFAASAVGQEFKRLPPDYVIPPSKDSPGKVTFSHENHLDPKKPGCTRCHPGNFKIADVPRDQTPGGEALTADGKPITHKAMEQGRYCGQCHGKTAFNFDDCTMCHR
ncbi:MAG TPA: c(7)-type cytochrome triheme domain-containing protein [Anaeromyxobacteraceae bacterium]|nr:c(7)-type cytochrome triheme domain-containing protein [Anaeromyxobacteraceae bacterium]